PYTALFRSGLAVGRQHGAVGLAGDAARLQRQRASGPLDRLAFDIEHVSSFVSRGRIPRGVPSMGGASGVQSFGPWAATPSRRSRMCEDRLSALASAPDNPAARGLVLDAERGADVTPAPRKYIPFVPAPLSGAGSAW